MQVASRSARLAALAAVLALPGALSADALAATPSPTPTATATATPGPSVTPAPASPIPTPSAQPSPTPVPQPSPVPPPTSVPAVPGIPSMKLVWGQSQAWEGTTPLVDGYTAEGATTPGHVEVFDNPACEGTPVGTAGIRKNGYWGDVVKVKPDAITPLFAVVVDAGGRSPCPPQPQVSYIHVTVRDPATVSFQESLKTPAPTPTPLVTPTPVLPELTLFAKSVRCVTAAGAKAKRPLPFSFAANAAVTLTIKVERSAGPRRLHTCPAAVGRGTGAPFRTIFGGFLTDFTSEPAGRGGLTGRGSIVPPKALGAGLYRLTTTAKASDGRTVSVNDHFWVLTPKKKR